MAEAETDNRPRIIDLTTPGYPDVDGVQADEKRRVFALLLAVDGGSRAGLNTQVEAAKAYEAFLKDGTTPPATTVRVVK